MMTPLEAARALAAANIEDEAWCAVCHMDPHGQACPVPMIPQIVAALEAAERIVFVSNDREPHACEYSFNDAGHAPILAFCGALIGEAHVSGCAWEALKAALTGADVAVPMPPSAGGCLGQCAEPHDGCAKHEGET